MSREKPLLAPVDGCGTAHAAGYHGDDRWLLLWAALIGVLGALATVAFHEGMAFAEGLATGHPGSLVAAAQSLAPWQRAITPALGGIVAGAFLWWARRAAKGKKQPDYLEAIAVGDGRQDVVGTLLRSASSLCTIASGGSIGREGAMVQLAAATGSWVGQLGRFEGDDLRLLLACRGGGGLRCGLRRRALRCDFHRRGRVRHVAHTPAGAADGGLGDGQCHRASG